MPTGTRQGQESHSYLGMCLLLPHKTVSRHPELGHACVPQIFDQCPDGVCFGNVVRSTEDKNRQTKIKRHSVSLPGTGGNGYFRQQHRDRRAQQLVLCALPKDTIRQRTTAYAKGYEHPSLCAWCTCADSHSHVHINKS